jgi:L-serine dehydratase
MHTSMFDLFKIGIGPSSSHTVGPMRAAYRFVEKLSSLELLDKVAKVRVELFGSLALTGLAHGTDRGVLLGLMGKQPDETDPMEIQGIIDGIRKSGLLTLLARHSVRFELGDLIFIKDALLPGHSNGMRFTALGFEGQSLDTRIYYSVGGGFTTEEGEPPPSVQRFVLYPFGSADELLEIGKEKTLPIHLIMLTNEMAWRPLEKIRDGVSKIWKAMQDCTARGLKTRGELARRSRSATPRRRHGTEPRKSKPWRSPHWNGLAERLGDRSERGKCSRRARRDRTHQRGRGNNSRGSALLSPFHARHRRRHSALLPRGRCHRSAL